MFIPQDEAELTKLVYWVRPPSQRDLRKNRAGIFAHQLAELPCLKDIKIFEDDESVLKDALEFRKIGRDGLYIASLIYLGLQRDPIACLTLAGILAQRTVSPLGIQPPNAMRLMARAIGWLAAMDRDRFEHGFGSAPQAQARIEAAKVDTNAGIDAALKRKLELNERRISPIEKPLRKWKSETTSWERYAALNSPLDLRGKLDRQGEISLLAALREEYPWAHDLLNDIETATALSIRAGTPWLFPVSAHRTA